MLTIDELVKLPLFSGLGPKELEYLARTVPDIHVARGDYVVHEGEARALIIVVEGKLEVTKVMDGEERVIASRLPGTLFGEVPMILNSPFLASMRAVETSRVIRIDPKVFHTLSAAAPEVSATVGAAALGRIGGLQELAKKPVAPELLVIGPRWLPSLLVLRNFLHRNQIEFEWIAPEDPAALALVAGAAGKFPLVRLPMAPCSSSRASRSSRRPSDCRSPRVAPRTTS